MENEKTHKKNIPFFKIILGVALLGFIVLVITGKKTWYSEDAPIEILSDMDNQFKAKPQVGSTFFANRAADQPVIPNTVPRDGVAYPLEKPDFERADSVIGANPLQPTDFVLARGQNRFEALCAPCHNNDGKGNGTVVEKGFQNPPSLLDEHAVGLSDAHLLHIISVGQNIMPGYGDKLNMNDRWTVVHYIRSLQAKR